MRVRKARRTTPKRSKTDLVISFSLFFMVLSLALSLIGIALTFIG